jgi:DNA ligase (NAD+)
MADSVVDFFSDPVQKEIIERLRRAGLNFEADEAAFMPDSDALAGKTFVFTGELESMTRREAAEKVESMGGRETKSVSKKTGYVVAGANPGSKYEKAKKLGINILSEEEFIELIK